MVRQFARFAFALLIGITAVQSAAAASRSYRCDDGIRPFTVVVTAVDPQTVRADKIDGKARILRMTQQDASGWTFAGGADNEYNMTFNKKQSQVSLNKPNSETIECALAAPVVAKPPAGEFEVAPWRKPGCTKWKAQCDNGDGKACAKYEETCQVN